MERAGVLINRLQEQLTEQANVHQMLVTAQLLQSELLLQCQQTNSKESKKVAVMMPYNISLPQIITAAAEPVQTDVPAPVTEPQQEPELVEEIVETITEPEPAEESKPVAEPEPTPEIIIEKLSESEPVTVPEPEPEPLPKPGPEPIPHFAEDKPWQRLFADQGEHSMPWTVDPMMEIPTLAHQEKIVFELNDVMVSDHAASLNDSLKQETNELATKLVDTPVKDLKKAISINDRHRFIQELFRGDETMYERSIKTINGFHIFAEAEFWMQRELKVKLGWDTTLELVKIFDQVVKRRFS